MSNFYQTKQWWRHSHSMIINKLQSVSFLHHTNQNYHPARFLIVINHLIRNTQSFAIFAALPRIFHNFSETPAGPRGGEKNCFRGGKTHKNTAKIFLRLRDIYKKYILQKNWVKTVIPAFSSGQSNLPPSYMGSQPPTR